MNSGEVMAGTVGGGGRLDFTVIGDTVNTASRVEEMTRETGDDILITEATRGRLERGVCEFEERPAAVLKGKARAVRLYAPTREAAEGEREAGGGLPRRLRQRPRREGGVCRRGSPAR